MFKVQVGDIVLVKETVTYAYRHERDFLVSKKVIRVTPTQFVVDDGSRFKKSGYKLGGSSVSRAYKTGELISLNGNTMVATDQSSDRDEFNARVLAAWDISYEFQIRLDDKKLCELSLRELATAKHYLTECFKIIRFRPSSLEYRELQSGEILDEDDEYTTWEVDVWKKVSPECVGCALLVTPTESYRRPL